MKMNDHPQQREQVQPTKAPKPWSAYGETERVKAAWIDWITKCGHAPTACCWHLPQGFRAAKGEKDETLIQRQIQRYFEVVERRAFKTAANSDGFISRLITSEYSPTVGWHAHGLVVTPSHMNDAEFRELLRRTWSDYYNKWTNPAFMPHLVYLEDSSDHYAMYILSSAVHIHDVDNINIRKQIDLVNTR